jgi:hypothetical protein
LLLLLLLLLLQLLLLLLLLLLLSVFTTTLGKLESSQVDEMLPLVFSLARIDSTKAQLNSLRSTARFRLKLLLLSISEEVLAQFLM